MSRDIDRRERPYLDYAREKSEARNSRDYYPPSPKEIRDEEARDAAKDMRNSTTLDDGYNSEE